MATVVVTLKIMPESVDTNLEELSASATEKISAFGGNVGKTDTEPIAFGLKSLLLMFSMPEEKGSTEDLEKQISELPGVRGVQVIDVRRTVG
ncbi:elongation factor 1-beta [Candidatus Woesearchaeota archaeon]|nr:elongation factor 1-beta [Candidatus Woesearchaeota archaeon]|tara:strand:+ start:13622 stop:13897 length:276 start_codon:yes stop_codon:yes gene_type:complete